MSTLALPESETAQPSEPSSRFTPWQVWGVILLAPYVLVFLVFVLYPVGYGLFLARHPASYVKLYDDPIFARAVVNTLFFLIVGINIKMIVALLLSAIIWNVGTWYLGLPASSSHTLIGSIVGVGLMNSLIAGQGFGEGVNWGKVEETMFALVTSPMIGFIGAAAVLALARLLIKNPELYGTPMGKAPPPWRIRWVLLLTCTGVSFAHGSNDGQKGMGLIMLILIGLVPATYALHLPLAQDKLQAIIVASHAAQPILARAPSAGPLDDEVADDDISRFLTTETPDARTLPAMAQKNADVATTLGSVASVQELSAVERSRLRHE